MPYPQIAGKLFIRDKTDGILACYLGLTNGTSLTLVSGNDGIANRTWSHSDNGGWTNREYGWRNTNNSPKNQIYFNTPDPIFRSDGVRRKLTFEVLYNPGGVGYNKGRLKINDVVIHENGTAINTDANGWFNLPIEFEFDGYRAICSTGPDFGDVEDFISDPETYSGYVAGYEVSEYRLYSGVDE